MLNKEKGITLIALIVTIIVLLILAGITIGGAIQGVDNAQEDKALADLETIQHAITQRDTKYKLTKDTSLLVGTKIDITSLTDVPEDIHWKVVEFSSSDPEREYYRINGNNLATLGLEPGSGKAKNKSYIINYYTGEVYNEIDKVTSSGVTLYTTNTVKQVSGLGDDIIKNGLLVWYDGENNTGNGHSSTATTWKDLSGNGRDGIMKKVTVGSNYAEFNGTSSWVNMGEINDYTSKVTLDATFSMPEIQEGIHQIINNLEQGGIALFVKDGNPYFQVRINSIGYVYKYDEDLLSIDKKYNIVGVFDDNTIDIYINGVKQEIADIIRQSDKTPITLTGINQIKKPNSNTVMALGVNPNGSNASSSEKFKGKIYSARIYNRALSADEVMNNYIVDKNKYGITE